MLDNVAQAGSTQWSIVYDIKNHRAYFRTQAARDVRFVDLAGLKFDCDTPVAMLDMNAALSGDISKQFKTYDPEANKKLVRSSFAKTAFLSDTSADMLDALANYPDATACDQEAAGHSGK